MVSFQHLIQAISHNPHASVKVAMHRVLPQLVAERFKLPAMRIEPVVIPKVVVKPVRIPSPVRSDSEEEAGYEPAPPIVPTRPKPLYVVAKTETEEMEKSHLQQQVMPTQQPQQQPASPTRARGKPLDPICIGIEHRDAMYAIANRTAQASIECEEARRLEALIDTLYKSESGRSRGWTKTKLNAFFNPRGAVGSRVNVRDAFDWSKIHSDKDTSAILDFICLAKGIRLLVWNDSQTAATLWPAADATAPRDIPIEVYHVNTTGCLLPSQSTPPRLHAPLSVIHSLEKLTICDLDAIAEKMGFPEIVGKKTEKVHVLASARMKMRFTSTG